MTADPTQPLSVMERHPKHIFVYNGLIRFSKFLGRFNLALITFVYLDSVVARVILPVILWKACPLLSAFLMIYKLFAKNLELTREVHQNIVYLFAILLLTLNLLLRILNTVDIQSINYRKLCSTRTLILASFLQER